MDAPTTPAHRRRYIVVLVALVALVTAALVLGLVYVQINRPYTAPALPAINSAMQASSPRGPQIVTLRQTFHNQTTVITGYLDGNSSGTRCAMDVTQTWPTPLGTTSGAAVHFVKAPAGLMYVKGSYPSYIHIPAAKNWTPVSMSKTSGIIVMVPIVQFPQDQSAGGGSLCNLYLLPRVAKVDPASGLLVWRMRALRAVLTDYYYAYYTHLIDAQDSNPLTRGVQIHNVERYLPSDTTAFFTMFHSVRRTGAFQDDRGRSAGLGPDLDSV